MLSFVLLIAARPAIAWAGPPPIPPGQEEAILELVEPIEFGDRLFAAHTLHSMTIDGSTIVFWIAPPDLEDPKDGSAYGQVRLYHPDFAPERAKQIKGFAIELIEPGESGASVQKVADRIEANADDSMWGVERLGVDSRSGGADPREGWGRWWMYGLGLALLGSFIAALRGKKHPWLAVALLVATGVLVATATQELCPNHSILGRTLGASEAQRLAISSLVSALGAVSLWIVATRLGLETLPALAAGMAFAMSPWVVTQGGSDAAAVVAASLVAVSLALMLEAAAAAEPAARVLGCASLACLALALRGCPGLAVIVVTVPLLRRSEGAVPAHRRWLVAGVMVVGLLAGLPPFVEHEIGFAQVMGTALGLVHPATGSPLVTMLALVGMLAPGRSETRTRSLRWVAVGWLLLALSSGSQPLSTLPWCLLAGLGFHRLFARRERLARAAAIALAAAALLGGVAYARSGKTPQIERCV